MKIGDLVTYHNDTHWGKLGVVTHLLTGSYQVKVLWNNELSHWVNVNRLKPVKKCP